jgi:hypothetical protein
MLNNHMLKTSITFVLCLTSPIAKLVLETILKLVLTSLVHGIYGLNTSDAQAMAALVIWVDWPNYWTSCTKQSFKVCFTYICSTISV